MGRRVVVPSTPGAGGVGPSMWEEGQVSRPPLVPAVWGPRCGEEDGYLVHPWYRWWGSLDVGRRSHVAPETLGDDL